MSLFVWCPSLIRGVPLQGKASGQVEFRHTELPDPQHKGNLLLKDLDITINSGETLAMVLMDYETRNPLEMLLERYYDPSYGHVVCTINWFER